MKRLFFRPRPARKVLRVSGTRVVLTRFTDHSTDHEVVSLACTLQGVTLTMEFRAEAGPGVARRQDRSFQRYDYHKAQAQVAAFRRLLTAHD